MPTVSFITFCHPPHLERLHSPGVLAEILNSHAYLFNEVIVVHQRCHGLPCRKIVEVSGVKIYESETWAGNGDYAPILERYGLPANDSVADEMTHGPSGPHYWKWHCVNHLIGLDVATSAYIVFGDCDTKMIHQPEGKSWITEGIHILKARPEVFCVSPSDGGGERLTQTMSQQLFLVDAARMRKGPLGLPWNGQFDAPGGPFQEYYFLAEGRIGRLLTTKGWYRYVLPDRFRYWHFNPWDPKGV